MVPLILLPNTQAAPLSAVYTEVALGNEVVLLTPLCCNIGGINLLQIRAGYQGQHVGLGGVLMGSMHAGQPWYSQTAPPYAPGHSMLFRLGPELAARFPFQHLELQLQGHGGLSLYYSPITPYEYRHDLLVYWGQPGLEPLELAPWGGAALALSSGVDKPIHVLASLGADAMFTSIPLFSVNLIVGVRVTQQTTP